MYRTILYTSFDKDDAFSRIDKLEALHIKTFKKRLPIDLFFSSSGDIKRPTYGVIAAHEAENDATVAWMKESV